MSLGRSDHNLPDTPTNNTLRASYSLTDCPENETTHLPSAHSTEDVFVPAVPILTIITKQAEISSTDKFVSTKKVNLSVNTQPLPLTRDISVNLRQKSFRVSEDEGQTESKIPVQNLFEKGSRTRSKRAAFYWEDSEETELMADGAKSDLVEQQSTSRVVKICDGETHSPDDSAHELYIPGQTKQIHRTRSKKKMLLTLKSDDNLGVRFVLPTPDSASTIEDSAQHRKLLASRVAQLANQVFGLEDDTEFVPHPINYTPAKSKELSPQYSESSSEYSELSPLSSELSPQYSEFSPLSSELFPQYSVLHEKESELSTQCSELASTEPVTSIVVDFKSRTLDVLDTDEFLSPIEDPIDDINPKSDNQLQSSQFNSQDNSSPKILPSTVPQLATKRDKRNVVLTNGSLKKHVAVTDIRHTPTPPLPQLDNLSQSSVTNDQTSVDSLKTSRETFEETSSCSSKDEISRAQRPNTLDVAKDLRTEMISSLIRPTPDIGITPTDTPRSCGLINPGFVFEFSPKMSSENGALSTKPASSPSLLDVLHKKYWANSSPSSTLSRKHSEKSDTLESDVLKTSEFRSRHESYCRVVDQNTNDVLGFQTLPSSLRKSSLAEDKAMRMFGDVSMMFSTLPVRNTPEQRQRTSSDNERVVVDKRQVDKDAERLGSAGKLSTLTATITPIGTTTGSTKLTRKFSLSPRVIRRKIIARLQPDSDKTGSSESEPDDLLTASRFKDGLHVKKKQDLEIETLEACTWLEQAGFPQYVQLFEDSQLPIDLQTVQKDHTFLDQQQLQSLFRRLNTLNKSVHMKLDINSKKQLYVRGGDEEEDTCVLSDKWHFERASGRWSHIDAATSTEATADSTIARMRSCSSRDSVMTDATTGDGEETGDSASPTLQFKNSVNNNNSLNVKVIDQSLSDTSSSTTSPKAQQTPDNQPKQSKQSKQRNGSFFLRHVGSLNRRASHKTHKKDKSSPNAVPLISGPTLMNTPDMTERMQRLGCIDINPNDLYNNNNNSTNKLLRSASADATTQSYCDCDTYSIDSTVTEYMLPEDYVLGTFPKELLASQVPSRQNSISSSSRPPQAPNKCSHSQDSNGTTNQNISISKLTNQKTATNRLSVYDNLPLEVDFILPVVDSASVADAACKATNDKSEARRELDAVLQDLLFNITNLDLDSDDVSSNLLFSTEQRLSSLSLQSSADNANSVHRQVDSAIVSPMSEDLSSLPDTPLDTPVDSPLDTPVDTPADTPELKRSVAGSSHRELLTSTEELCPSRDDVDVEVEEVEPDDGSIREMQETIWRERRDSGVGSSLTREPMERKKKVRLRWHSFVASHRPSFNSQNQQISGLSAGQLMYLRRLSLLKVTSLMEQYSPSHKSGFSLQLVNRFIKKSSRTPDYNDKKVFGVPLSVMLQRTGQPLPQCILHAMRHLRKSAPDAVGIFRKPGVKSRIQKLRNDLDKDPDNVTQFDSMQSFDVADMFKQYLRELPECLVTNKLSETFLAIYQHVPQELRLEALQACSLLLPDENREVLESLLYFLSDMASYHEENQMTASNLAMCFAPSLFNIHNRTSQSKSPKSTHKNAVGLTVGLTDQKEFQEQRSATDCLTSMIVDCKKVFRIPEDFLSKCSSSSSYMEAGEPAPLSLLAGGAAPDYNSHIETCIKGILKESKDKTWSTVPPLGLALSGEDSNLDVSYKKVHDNNPLRLWKCCTEVEAPPVEVLNRVLNERQKWDEDLIKWRTVEKLDTELDVFQYVCNSMAPQPSREYLILRAWKQELPKGSCALVMHSIDHEVSSLGGGIRGIVLASHYLIEPCGSGRSKLTYISRIDSRGRQAKWYNRSYGSIAANSVIRIKESFSKPKALDIHETKV